VPPAAGTPATCATAGTVAAALAVAVRAAGTDGTLTVTWKLWGLPARPGLDDVDPAGLARVRRIGIRPRRLGGVGVKGVLRGAPGALVRSHRAFSEFQ
jgi:hypothetical protein